jgi:hypothetical protein
VGEIVVDAAQSEKISLDSPTDIVIDTGQSEKISLDSHTDIVVDSAQSEKISQGNIFTLGCIDNNISGGI